MKIKYRIVYVHYGCWSPGKIGKYVKIFCIEFAEHLNIYIIRVSNCVVTPYRWWTHRTKYDTVIPGYRNF